jgi:uridine monophosphate synthetase
MTVELYHGDCLEILPSLKMNRVTIITDPPWGLDLDTDYSKWPGGIKHKRVKGDKIPFDYGPWLEFRAVDQLWFGAEYFVNFPRGTGTWICWSKYPTDKNDKRYAGAFELIWRRKRGKRRIVKIKAINTSWVTTKESVGHPTQKPVALMEWLINEYTKPGSLVFDPYMGVGSTGVACVRTGRSFVGAEIEKDYFDIATDRITQAQAVHFRERINGARSAIGTLPSGRPPSEGPSELTALILDLARIGAVRFGTFTLKSGKTSPIYIDLRLLASHPDVLRRSARAYAGLLRDMAYDRIAAIPYAGLPIGAAVALETGRPLIYPRKEAKSYGTRRAIEGTFEAGERAVVLDDLITTGGSKVEAIAPLKDAGLDVQDVVVLIDRQSGGHEELARQGYRLHAVLTLRQILDVLAAQGQISETQRETVLDWLTGA